MSGWLYFYLQFDISAVQKVLTFTVTSNEASCPGCRCLQVVTGSTKQQTSLCVQEIHLFLLVILWPFRFILQPLVGVLTFMLGTSSRKYCAWVQFWGTCTRLECQTLQMKQWPSCSGGCHCESRWLSLAAWFSFCRSSETNRGKSSRHVDLVFRSFCRSCIMKNTNN